MGPRVGVADRAQAFPLSGPAVESLAVCSMWKWSTGMLYRPDSQTSGILVPWEVVMTPLLLAMVTCAPPLSMRERDTKVRPLPGTKRTSVSVSLILFPCWSCTDADNLPF